ncbi:MAG: signal peptidase I [Mycoplasmatales bacterium]
MNNENDNEVFEEKNTNKEMTETEFEHELLEQEKLEKQARKQKIMKEVKEWTYSLLLVILIVALFNFFFIRAQVSGDSMDTTYSDGENVLGFKRFKTLKQNDVIAFLADDQKGGLEYHIKRIIGTPGDVVKIDGSNVYVNDKLVIDKLEGEVQYRTYELSSTQYFVIGDNYRISLDSRTTGPVESDAIKSKIIFSNKDNPNDLIEPN